jgi:hypothetical protein
MFFVKFVGIDWRDKATELVAVRFSAAIPPILLQRRIGGV